MKRVILSLALVAGLGMANSAQAQGMISEFRASQVQDKELIEGSVGVYEPQNTKYKTFVFLDVMIGTPTVVMGLDENKRKQFNGIIEAYEKLAPVMKAPDELPSKMEIGRLSCPFGFQVGGQGDYYLDSYQDVVFSIKWDRNGEPELSVFFGKLQSDKFPDRTLDIPNIFIRNEWVDETKYAMAEWRIQNYKAKKNDVLSPGAQQALEKLKSE